MSRPPLPANRPLPVYRSPLPPPLDLIYNLAVNLANNGSSVINLFFAQPNVGHYDKLKTMRDFELNNLCTNASNNQSTHQSINQFDVLAIGKLFKDILNREKPLFGYDMFDRLIDIQKRYQSHQSNEQSINQSNSEKCAELSKLIHQSMDSDHRLVLNEVIKLFDRLIDCSIITQLTSDKLSYAFGPALIRPDPSIPINQSNLMVVAQNTKQANDLLKFVIEHRQQIFNQSTNHSATNQSTLQTGSQPMQSHSQPNSPAINQSPNQFAPAPPSRPFGNSASHPSLVSINQSINQMNDASPVIVSQPHHPPPINQPVNPSTVPSPPSPVILHDHLSPTTMHQMTVAHPPPPPPPSVNQSIHHPPPSTNQSIPPPPPSVNQSTNQSIPMPPRVSLSFNQSTNQSNSAPPPPPMSSGPPAPPSINQSFKPSTNQSFSNSSVGPPAPPSFTQPVNQSFSNQSAPLPPGPPAPPSINQSINQSARPSASKPGDRGALLAGIQGFGKNGLKKTQTVDKSAPAIDGKPPVSQSASQSSGASTSHSDNQSSNQAFKANLGGLFTGGMPTLRKSTGGPPLVSQSNNQSVPPPPKSVNQSIPPPHVPSVSQSSSYNLPPPPPPITQSINQSGPPMPPPITQSTNQSGPPMPPPVNQSTNQSGPPMPPPINQSGPPAPPGAPSAPIFAIKKSSTSQPNDRGALLAGIQGFGKGGLRKTQTTDKSAPAIDDKPPINQSINQSTSQSSSSAPPPRPSMSQAPAGMSMQDEMAARMAKMRASRGG